MDRRGGSSGDAEIRLRSRMVDRAAGAGLFASNVNDRFVSAKPDMRFGHRWVKSDMWQLDVELKILGVSQLTIRSRREVLSGVTKLQEIELRDMNKAGMRAVGLILLPELNTFVFCNYKTIIPSDALDGPTVEFNPKKTEDPLDWWQLFASAEAYLRSINAW